MFPYHGHLLSWYEFAELINPESHNIAVTAMKKVDLELMQATSAAIMEYTKKQKCVELERVEREKAMQISEITTKGSTHGMLAGLDASLARKVDDNVNVLLDLLALKMLHDGKGFILSKETMDTISTFAVKYLETKSGGRTSNESGIPVSRLTVTPFAIFGDGLKQWSRNEVVTPDGDSATAEHPTICIKTHLQEGFADGWAKGWWHHDFSKQTMTYMEISEKCCPNVCGSKGTWRAKNNNITSY